MRLFVSSFLPLPFNQIKQHLKLPIIHYEIDSGFAISNLNLNRTCLLVFKPIKLFLFTQTKIHKINHYANSTSCTGVVKINRSIDPFTSKRLKIKLKFNKIIKKLFNWICVNPAIRILTSYG